MPETPQPKLSQLQKKILRHVLHLTEQQGTTPPANLLEQLKRRWGVPWHTEGTRTQQASFARALARLEERGLLLRQCDWSTELRHSKEDPAPPRTTQLLLTPEGRDLAKRLT